MSTTDGPIDQKKKLWFRMDTLFSATENSYWNETSAVNKILFLLFGTNQ